MYEILHEQGIKARNSVERIASIPAAVVCDAKLLYDSVKRVVSLGLPMEKTFMSGKFEHQRMSGNHEY